MHSRRSSGLAPLLVLTLAACGSAAPPASEEHHEHDDHHAGGEGHHEHASLPPELDSLHEVLAPVWHEEAGPSRAASACENASVLQDRSALVNGMVTPEHADREPWSAATARLVTSAEALVAECSATGPAVETRLSELHDAFHVLMELASSEHAHGEHHEEAVTTE